MKGWWAAILSGWLVDHRLTGSGWLFTCWLVGRRVALVGMLRCSADWQASNVFGRVGNRHSDC